MRNKLNHSKADLFVSMCCVGFLAVCLGAIGGGGRKSAKEALCLSNLRQWGNVWQMYTNDNSGYFNTWDWVKVQQTRINTTWPNLLRPYYKDAKLRCCPLAANPGSQASPANAAWGVFSGTYPYETQGDYGSYGSNAWTQNDKGSPFDQKCWKTPNVENAKDVPVFLDATWFMGWPYASDTPPEYNGQMATSSMVNNMGMFCIDRSGEGTTNSLFMDWSVRKVGIKELWRLKWQRTYDTTAPLPFWPVWMTNYKDYN
jgi:hypothetical protein